MSLLSLLQFPYRPLLRMPLLREGRGWSPPLSAVPVGRPATRCTSRASGLARPTPRVFPLIKVRLDPLSTLILTKRVETWLEKMMSWNSVGFKAYFRTPSCVQWLDITAYIHVWKHNPACETDVVYLIPYDSLKSL